MYTYLHVLCPSLRVLEFGKAQRHQQGEGSGAFCYPFSAPPPRERKKGKKTKEGILLLKGHFSTESLKQKATVRRQKCTFHESSQYISKYKKTYFHPWKTHFNFVLNGQFIYIIYDAILYVFFCFLNVRRLSLSLIA